MKMMGIRNTVYYIGRWYMLFFWDYDSHVYNYDWAYDKFINFSFVHYSTAHGSHLVCLTPVTYTRWAGWYEEFYEHYGGDYSGITIRVSKKPGEVRRLIRYNDEDIAIESLANVYERMFGIEFPKKVKAHIMIERYYTNKGEV